MLGGDGSGGLKFKSRDLWSRLCWRVVYPWSACYIPGSSQENMCHNFFILEIVWWQLKVSVRLRFQSRTSSGVLGMVPATYCSIFGVSIGRVDRYTRQWVNNFPVFHPPYLLVFILLPKSCPLLVDQCFILSVFELRKICRWDLTMLAFLCLFYLT